MAVFVSRQQGLQTATADAALLTAGKIRPIDIPYETKKENASLSKAD
ncbi:hypothetical protein [Lacrimispora sp.]